MIGPPYVLRIRDDQRIADYFRPSGNVGVARPWILQHNNAKDLIRVLAAPLEGARIFQTSTPTKPNGKREKETEEADRPTKAHKGRGRGGRGTATPKPKLSHKGHLCQP